MTQTTVGRLTQLANTLQKQRPAYYRAIDAGRGLSARLYRQIDEYDSHRHTEAWEQHCKLHGLSLSHRALDLFA